MLSNDDIWRIALQQSAYDCNCAPEDFLAEQNVVRISKTNPLARKYLTLPLACDLVSYGTNVVAQASEELVPLVWEYIERYPAEHCFETPNMHVLDEAIAPYGLKICFMAEYFLPDVNAVKELRCDYELRVLHQEDFAELYLPQWSNALCEKRKQLDVLGVGAYDGGKLIGLAGCSADCEMMYQIGVDVLPEYRRRGIASAMTSRLALEILALNKVPFYCAAWCNIKSVRNAIRSGFRPAWVAMTAKEAEFVEEMNRSFKETCNMKQRNDQLYEMELSPGRLYEIRKAEAESHTEAYTNHALFAPGSWLAKPVKTVLDLLPLFEGYMEFRGLDLGSGVGRNSIPVAQYFKHIPCRVDCVDILELAIEKLNENARQYGIASSIRGIVSSIDDYEIEADSYDLIMAISALEHIASRSAFEKKLVEIRNGLRIGGAVCLIVNSGVIEHEKATGEELSPQFEVNIQTAEMRHLLEQTFAGWQIIKHTVVHQKYDIPRENGLAELESDVVTYVFRRNT